MLKDMSPTESRDLKFICSTLHPLSANTTNKSRMYHMGTGACTVRGCECYQWYDSGDGHHCYHCLHLYHEHS
jgi:hypothetical protein